MDKTGRNGLRVGDILAPNWNERYQRLRSKHLDMLRLYDDVPEWESWEADFFEAVEYLRSLTIVNGEYWLNNHLSNGKKVLAEGAQGSMLDVDYGTYPFVTSSNTIVAGVCTGLGVAPAKIGEVFGITKAYCTRVGSGPFPTELDDEIGEQLRAAGHEFGAVTKRPRRCGWMDLVALRYVCMLSGVTRLIVTKADVLDDFNEIKVATAYNIDGNETDEFPFDICDREITPVYKTFQGWDVKMSECKTPEELPETFKNYCRFVESFLQTRVQFISNGTGRDQLLKLF
jgi:adenylosuccinate synthase